MKNKPLAIDLFCGLGGWTDGLLAEGYDVIGFDIERHAYGDQAYQGKLVIQDICTIHGSQFKNATLIVASPPCQEYSYMAMPWSLAKAKAKAIRADTTGEKLAALNRLFNECFRIQKEASLAAGRHIPMVVENVRGAIPWVGRSRWNFGSFHLWGDVPALMPMTIKAQKFNPDGTEHPPGSWFAIADSKNRGARSEGQKVPGFRFDGSGKSFQSASVAETGAKAPGMNWSDQTKRGQDFTRIAGKHALVGVKVPSAQGRRTDLGKGARFTSRDCGIENTDGRKQAGIGGVRKNGKGDAWFQDGAAEHGSRPPARKAASAMIAKIPLPLSRHIAAVYRPSGFIK